MKVRSLKFNSVVNLIKTILGIIFPLITFPYASRVLGATGIGKVDYANSISNYFILFASLGIATYTIREGAKVRDDKKKLDQLVTEIFVINSISTVVAYICLFICSSLPVFKNYQELILLNGTIMIFDLIGVNWLFNIFEDYIYITVRTLAFQIISLVLLFVFVQTPEDYLIYAGLIVFANAGANIFNIFYGRKYVLSESNQLSCTGRRLSVQTCKTVSYNRNRTYPAQFRGEPIQSSDGNAPDDLPGRGICG